VLDPTEAALLDELRDDLVRAAHRLDLELGPAAILAALPASSRA
jgi:hypothetical protein